MGGMSSEEDKLISDEDEEEAASSKDPVFEAIGEFGFYQLYVCVIGFFMSIPNCWVALSLKFIGMRTNFTCIDSNILHNSSFDGVCYGPDGPCQNFLYDQSQFSSTIVERWDLVCDKASYDSFAKSVFFAGSLFGVLTSGVLADMLGRKPVMLVLVVLFCVSGVLGALTSSFYTWLALRFMLGAASIGMSTVRFTIQMELVGSKYRTWGNMLNSLGWSAGYMLLPVMAYVTPNMAHLEMFIGLCGVPFISLYWLYPESPKWLISKGRVKDAEEVARRICSWNKKPFKGLDVPVFPSKLSETKGPARVSSLLGFPNLRRNMICMSFTWFSTGMIYYGIALHTPEFGSNVYMVFFLAGLIEVPTNLLGPWLLNFFGRKAVLIGSFLLCALCLFGAAVIPVGMFNKEWLTVTLITTGKVWIGFCFECCYIWTSEIFPTVIRNSSVSVCSSFARVGAIISPLIVEIDKDDPMAPILIYGIFSLVAGLNSILIYPESKDCTNLPDSLEEGEMMAARDGSTSKQMGK